MPLDLIRPDWPAPARVQALSTARTGGCSSAPYTSFNLALHVGDDASAVQANRARLAEFLPAEPAWLNQVHGKAVVDVRDAVGTSSADAAFARQANQVCAVMTADCLPVLFCDRDATVVAAAHAGWRGLADGVLEATIAAMQCDPARLMAWLGPAIGPAHFEVGDDVYRAFTGFQPKAEAAFTSRGGKWLAHIYRLARLRLEAAGVTQTFGGDYCTYRDAARFYSYRRDGVTGRMASLIWLADA